MALSNLNSTMGPQLLGLPGGFSPLTQSPLAQHVAMGGAFQSVLAPSADDILASLKALSASGTPPPLPNAGAEVSRGAPASIAQTMGSVTHLPSTLQSALTHLPGQVAAIPGQVGAALGNIPSDIHSAIQGLLGLFGRSGSPITASQPQQGVLGPPPAGGTIY